VIFSSYNRVAFQHARTQTDAVVI